MTDERDALLARLDALIAKLEKQRGDHSAFMKTVEKEWPPICAALFAAPKPKKDTIEP